MGTCRPTPTQFYAVCADWHRRTGMIARLGADGPSARPDILPPSGAKALHQLRRIGLDLATAAWSMELACLTGHGHDPVALSILMGNVDVRLQAIERALGDVRDSRDRAETAATVQE